MYIKMFPLGEKKWTLPVRDPEPLHPLNIHDVL